MKPEQITILGLLILTFYWARFWSLMNRIRLLIMSIPLSCGILKSVIISDTGWACV